MISRLCGIGLDETATKRGHHYVTIFVDMDRKAARCPTPGKARMPQDLCRVPQRASGQSGERGRGDCDMSPAFLSAAEATFRNAAVTVDWFHVVQIFTKALDEVRRLEAQRSYFPRLPGGRFSRAWKLGVVARSRSRRSRRNVVTTATARVSGELLRWVRKADTRQGARWRATRFPNSLGNLPGIRFCSHRYARR